MDTALKIGMEKGFEALSTRTLIRKMGCSTGVVYHHFRDKQEIIDAIEAAETQRTPEKIPGLLDSAKNIVENMTAVFYAVMLPALREPEKYSLIVPHTYSRQAQGLPRWSGHIGEGLRKWTEAFLPLLLAPL